MTQPNDAWNKGGPYERYVGGWSRRVAPRFLQWIDAGPALRWLDVGCGSGALTGLRPAVRARLRFLLLVAVTALPGRAPAASLADAEIAEALEAHAEAVAGVQAELLVLCESAPSAERFELYRTYNHSAGTTLQVAFLREALRAWMTSTSGADREARRSELAQQAQFTLWEIDGYIAALEEAAVAGGARARIESALLEVLREIRSSVSRAGEPADALGH
jgi:hypothetical protein